MEKLPEIISIQELNNLLKECKSKEFRLAFKLGFFCCLRISEVIKLQENDVDYSRRMLFIRQAKGSKDRYVPFPKPLLADLKFLPIQKKRITLQKGISRIGLRVLNKDIHFHTLRHSGATYYLNSGMNIREVQRLLGHSKLDTTMIYTHINPKDILIKMDELFK